MKINLRLQLMGFSLSLVLLVGGAICLSSIWQGRKRALETFHKDAQGIVALLARTVANDVNFLDARSLRSVLENARVNPDIRRTFVMDSEGVILADGASENRLPRRKSSELPDAEIQLSKDWATRISGEILQVHGPILLADGRLLGYIQVEFALARVQGIVRDTARMSVYLTLICLTIGGVLAFLFSSTVVRPILSIVKASRQLGAGTLGVRVELDRSDELGVLAESINQMAFNLRASRAFVDNVIKSMVNALIVASPGGTIKTVNRATLNLLGYAENELDEMPIEMIFDREEGKPLKGEGIEELISSGFISNAEQTWVAKDGRKIPVTFSGSVMRDDDGRIEGIVCVAQDISERRRSEEFRIAKESAEKANRAKSSFLANMSHELRTPLNAIIGYSEMMIEEAQEAGHQAFLADLQKIRSAGKHQLTVINDILDLSKIEAGKLDVVPLNFDILSMVEEVVSTMRPLATQKGNSLTVDCGENLGVIHADETKIRQSLLNLLSNACKFTENGDISLEVARYSEEGKDWVRCRVRDTGIGMTSEHMQKLFMPFSQVDASTTRRYGGTGLGLTISRTFCRMMGGDILVESALGEGSLFTMQVPAAPAGAGAEPAANSPGETGQAAGRAEPLPGDNTVLVIDDDPTVHDLIARFLIKEGYRVVGSAGGEEGIELARRLRPVALILDILMPGMDGWAVLTAMKGDPELAAIPVMLHTVVDNKSLGRVLGASDYLTKPIDANRLIAALKKYKRNTPAGPVLVVEDDDGLRQMITRVLKKRGRQVSEAENGRVALERVLENRPGFILLDLSMPEMDGLEFVKELRQRTDCQSIPIVVITGQQITEENRRELDGKVSHVLQKGDYTSDELLEQVQKLVSPAAPPATRGG